VTRSAARRAQPVRVVHHGVMGDERTFFDAVAAGLRDALLCGMWAEPVSGGGWRRDWHPRSGRAAFVGVTEEFDRDGASLVVLFRSAPRWDALYAWRAVLWSSPAERTGIMRAFPDTDRLVGALAFELMQGIDGGRWRLPADAPLQPLWRLDEPPTVAWVIDPD